MATRAKKTGNGDNENTAPARTPRERAVDALIALLGERPWGQVGLHEIAERAGLSLGELKALFPSTGAILGAFTKDIDADLLKEPQPDAREGSVRDRLFDLLMQRLDALAPHKGALKNLMRGLRTDPLSASAVNSLLVNSMQWTLASAGVREAGPVGAARAQALVVLFARVMEVWFDDEEPDMARTMRTLDRELGRAERLAEATRGLDGLNTAARAFCDAVGSFMRAKKPQASTPE